MQRSFALPLLLIALWAAPLGGLARGQIQGDAKADTKGGSADTKGDSTADTKGDAKADAKGGSTADTKTAAPPEDKVPGEEDERGFFEVHQWGVWMADPALDQVNAREQFLTAMPTAVETTRPRRMKDDKKPPAPVNVVTFYRQPAATIDIDLRAKGGTFVAHWPPAQVKSNRLHWPEYELAAAAPADAAWLTVPAEHWFSTVRKTDALVLRKGARAERLVTYDFEAPFPLPLKLEGGPDTYNVRSMSTYPVHDLVIVVPTESGRRIGWLETLPAAPAAQPKAAEPKADADETAKAAGADGQPAAAAAAAPQAVAVAAVQAAAGGTINPAKKAPKKEQPAHGAESGEAARPLGPPVPVVLSQPLAAGSDALAALSTGALADRLGQTGLDRREIDLLLSLYGPTIFAADALTVAWRIPAGMVDDLTPLVIEPEPAKSVRVVLVVARNLDPKIEESLQTLVDQLGSPQYKQREAAEQRLVELGSLAFPVLKKSLTHKDPEIAFRAERLLLDQQQSIDLPGGAQQ
jgi:hypothetical protein